MKAENFQASFNEKLGKPFFEKQLCICDNTQNTRVMTLFLVKSSFIIFFPVLRWHLK
jgi:hypothetical protein